MIWRTESILGLLKRLGHSICSIGSLFVSFRYASSTEEYWPSTPQDKINTCDVERQHQVDATQLALKTVGLEEELIQCRQKERDIRGELMVEESAARASVAALAVECEESRYLGAG